MKKIFKDLLPSVILSFSVTFMMFIYEPIVMYSNNINDFWFDLKILLNVSTLMFVIMLILIFLFYLLFYIISRMIPKKNKKFYNFTLIIGYILFISTYIEGNYLAGLLPPLDGTTIIWTDYTKASLISLIVLIIVSIIVVIIYKKCKEKTIDYLKYVSLAICAMLSVSLFTTITSTDALKKKKYTVTATTKNLNTYSENENFVILLLDAVDSVEFNKIVESSSEYKKIFSDFTYYPDTMSGYPFTRDSIPFILSGMWNNNEDEFKDYYVKAMDNSILLKELENKNYDINIYDTEIMYNSDNAKKIKNLSFENSYNIKSFMKQEVKYILFKYLPFYLKKYSYIETMDFKSVKILPEQLFDLSDIVFYNSYMNKFNTTQNNQFKFIHIEGAHVPFNLDKDLNSISNGTYAQKLEANITITKKYLDYLKENNIYENANIIIMADHGYSLTTGAIGRQNPILYIKGKNEKHDLEISDKAISYEDLSKVYIDLLNNKKSNEIFNDISKERERRYLFYYYTEENHMVEYMQMGKAWDEKTLIPTGKEFNR